MATAIFTCHLRCVEEPYDRYKVIGPKVCPSIWSINLEAYLATCFAAWPSYIDDLSAMQQVPNSKDVLNLLFPGLSTSRFLDLPESSDEPLDWHPPTASASDSMTPDSSEIAVFWDLLSLLHGIPFCQCRAIVLNAHIMTLGARFTKFFDALYLIPSLMVL